MGKKLSAKLQIFGKQSNGEYFPYSENTMAYTIINNVKKIDSYNEHIIMQNNLKIEIKEIININSNIFKNISFE